MILHGCNAHVGPRGVVPIPFRPTTSTVTAPITRCPLSAVGGIPLVGPLILTRLIPMGVVSPALTTIITTPLDTPSLVALDPSSRLRPLRWAGMCAAVLLTQSPSACGRRRRGALVVDVG